MQCDLDSANPTEVLSDKPARSISLWASLALANGGVWLILLVASTTTRTAFIDSLLFAVSIGQLSVLAVWLTFGTGKMLFRLILYFCLGGTVAAGGTAFNAGFAAAIVVALVVVSLFALAISLPLCVFWWKGWRLKQHAHQNPTSTHLSIRFLLALTALVAILLPVHNYVTSMGTAQADGLIGLSTDEFKTAGPIINVVMLLGLGLSVVTLFQSCLAARGFGSSIVAALLCIGLVMVLPMHVRFGSPAHIDWSGYLGCTFITVLSSLLFLRTNGLRLVRLTPQTE